jgi:lipoprotein-anchoring transpeptidase ErfK/SrfK
MFRLVFLAVFLVLAAGRPAAADLFISIDRANQRMTVFDDKAVYMWPVSTGAPGYTTPAGSFRPLRMAVEHYSKEWDDAPMPHSIFFTKAGHAIHGTTHTGSLGAPASHGCVRLAPEHAAFLFNRVEAHGLKATRIEVTGSAMQVSDAYQPRTYERVDLERELDRNVKRWIHVIQGLTRR